MKTRPDRAIFRDAAARSTLALDPGGAGLLADVFRGVQPQPGAFGYFDCPPPVCFVPEEVCEGVAVLAVSGPLEHHDSYMWTSYEALVSQIDRALACGDVSALILKIDSPGGVAAGMGEAHKAIRALAKTHGKPIYAYADEMACSAAYHLASACSEVWTSEAGVLGSVGVILCTIDESAALAKQGVAVRYVVTGARKADMHPGNPVTDEVLDVAQAKVDYLGGLFFRAVAKARGMTPAAVEGLQAAVFHGPAAVKAGLADGIAGWDAFFQYVKDSVRATTVTPKGDTLTAGASRTGTARTEKATMATKLQAQAALAAARGALKAATAALDASPSDPKLRKAWASALSAKEAAKAAVATAGKPDAKMSKVTKTSKHVTMEESDSEEESASSAASSASSSMGSSSSAEEEEEAAASTAKSSMPPPKGAAEEEEEEKAIAKAWAAAEHAYAKVAKAFDPYGVKYGPKGLRKAAAKATGEKTSISACLGALHALPTRHAADATVVADVAKMKADALTAKINAMVDAAKAEGKAPTKAMRASLREMGAKMGAAYLKGHLATLPALRTLAGGGFVPRAGTDGDALAVGGDDEAKMLTQMTAGMDPKAKAAYLADYRARLAASNPHAPKH